MTERSYLIEKQLVRSSPCPQCRRAVAYKNVSSGISGGRSRRRPSRVALDWDSRVDKGEAWLLVVHACPVAAVVAGSVL